MEIRQSLEFRKAYKKMNVSQRLAVNDEIRKVAADPKIGTEKKQDLSGVYVHKFKIHKEQYLLAYTFRNWSEINCIEGARINLSKQGRKNEVVAGLRRVFSDAALTNLDNHNMQFISRQILNPQTLILLMLDVHENFYRNLKRRL